MTYEGFTGNGKPFFMFAIKKPPSIIIMKNHETRAFELLFCIYWLSIIVLLWSSSMGLNYCCARQLSYCKIAKVSVISDVKLTESKHETCFLSYMVNGYNSALVLLKPVC